ncbi:MAG: hypothetical protein JXR76_23750 [Deltaproteobacteria bacterium]|nr:hypothetical protein [Deltaproteobacteria bacterium]MBN2671961.1 hypothetical protein [Deltaproteobacteria bacterium]
MSKKKRKSKTKNTSTPHGGFTSAERHTHGMPQKAAVDKMSEKLETMASQLLVHPASSNPVVVQAAVSLAQIAWNRTIKDVENRETDAKLLAHVQHIISSVFESPLKKELRETNVNIAVERLVQYKKTHFADDPREILAAMIHPDDDVTSDFDARIRVHWTYPDAEQLRQPMAPSGIIDLAQKLENRALSQKVISEVSRFRQNKVVDINSWKTGKLSAEAFHKEIAENKDLSALKWDHAIYMYVQNVVSHITEQVVMLPQMSWFHDILYRADNEYTPTGPPMSPLTGTFFFCWSMFDVCKGASRETVASVATAVYESITPDPDMLRMMRLFHTSRMGLYEHLGVSDGKIKFRELLLDRELTARCPSGYNGRKGEIWYARILPPPYPEKDDTHVVFTTPYVVLDASAAEWETCISSEIQRTKKSGRCTNYEEYMKYGPGFLYWPEYIFEAYVNHTPDMILLEGLPNQPESRPHSPAYKDE